MKVLAIDTSSVSGSVAVTNDGTLLSEFNTEKVGTHSEWLLPQIERLLAEVSLTVKDIDVFALSQGPGSFTGLRIGVSVLKGLSWGVGGRPIVGVSTLEALSLNLMGDTSYASNKSALIVPLLDARKKEIYSARFELSDAGEVRRLSQDVVISPEVLIEGLNGRGSAESVLFIGAGLGVYADMMKEDVNGAVVLPETTWNVRASNVAILAERAIADEGLEAASVSSAELTPLYIRRSEVEFKKAALPLS